MRSSTRIPLDRSDTMATKVTPDEAREIKKFAEVEGMSASEYLRSSALYYMALRGNGFALKLAGRGVIRVASEAASLLFGWAQQKGWDMEAGRGRR